MIMLPREVVERAIEALRGSETPTCRAQYDIEIDALVDLSAALDQPQGEQEPYLYYDPENGDTWTQEAINDGCCPPDSLIALYTK